MITAIRLVSDVHLEFGPLQLPVIEDEERTILVVAGDLGTVKTLKEIKIFIDDAASRFHSVIYIMGNHEYYGGAIPRSFNKIKDHIGGASNVHIVENEEVVIEGLHFLCATLWTTHNNGNPIAMIRAKERMNDYDLIRTGTKTEPYKRRLVPEYTYRLCMESSKLIFNALKALRDKTTIVITHHAPSSLSSDEYYKGDPGWSSYANNFESEIIETKPNLWLHGHIHCNNDYTIGDTRIVANPRGYDGTALNPDFNPSLTIKL